MDHAYMIKRLEEYSKIKYLPTKNFTPMPYLREVPVNILYDAIDHIKALQSEIETLRGKD